MIRSRSRQRATSFEVATPSPPCVSRSRSDNEAGDGIHGLRSFVSLADDNTVFTENGTVVSFENVRSMSYESSDRHLLPSRSISKHRNVSMGGSSSSDVGPPSSHYFDRYQAMESTSSFGSSNAPNNNNNNNNGSTVKSILKRFRSLSKSQSRDDSSHENSQESVVNSVLTPPPQLGSGGSGGGGGGAIVADVVTAQNVISDRIKQWELKKRQSSPKVNTTNEPSFKKSIIRGNSYEVTLKKDNAATTIPKDRINASPQPPPNDQKTKKGQGGSGGGRVYFNTSPLSRRKATKGGAGGASPNVAPKTPPVRTKFFPSASRPNTTVTESGGGGGGGGGGKTSSSSSSSGSTASTHHRLPPTPPSSGGGGGSVGKCASDTAEVERERDLTMAALMKYATKIKDERLIGILKKMDEEKHGSVPSSSSSSSSNTTSSPRSTIPAPTTRSASAVAPAYRTKPGDLSRRISRFRLNKKAVSVVEEDSGLEVEEHSCCSSKALASLHSAASTADVSLNRLSVQGGVTPPYQHLVDLDETEDLFGPRPPPPTTTSEVVSSPQDPVATVTAKVVQWSPSRDLVNVVEYDDTVSQYTYESSRGSTSNGDGCRGVTTHYARPTSACRGLMDCTNVSHFLLPSSSGSTRGTYEDDVADEEYHHHHHGVFYEDDDEDDSYLSYDDDDDDTFTAEGEPNFVVVQSLQSGKWNKFY